MKMIAIAFTLKGQSMDDIKKVLTQLSEQTGGTSGNTILLHGFMPRSVVLDKGFQTDLVDALDQLFPYQLNCYIEGKPRREVMADLLKKSSGCVYVIGEVKEGVQEEVDLYKSASVPVYYIPIDWTGAELGKDLTYGEMASGITSNPHNMVEVNEIKRLSASLIDELNRQRNANLSNGEKAAQFTLAIRRVQEGRFWGVNATTLPY